MKLKNQFIALSLLLAASGMSIFYMSTSSNRVLMYVAEVFLLLSLCFCVYFYRKVIKTLNALGNGMELLNEQDFGSRLALTGQYDTDRIVEVFNRMMTQLKTERLRLREQNGFLDLIIKSSPMGVVVLDFDNKVTSINKSALVFLGYNNEKEVLGKDINQLTTPLAERLRMVGQGASETLRIGDAMVYRCSKLSFVDRGAHHPFILIESLATEVMKAEKKAYEKVIRMIAHEVNNSVAGVTSTLDTIHGALSDVEDTDDFRDAMAVCVERCYGLSRFITRFADVVKIPEPIASPQNLNDCAMRCKAFMDGICQERGINLELDLYEETLLVNVDAPLIEQAFVNIIKNSVESIGHNGTITITTALVPFPSIIIADNGQGISDDVADKLFTPFFSTKVNGEGLGLIFIREVLLNHNCRFSLRTYDDKITRFSITFPKA